MSEERRRKRVIEVWRRFEKVAESVSQLPVRIAPPEVGEALPVTLTPKPAEAKSTRSVEAAADSRGLQEAAWFRAPAGGEATSSAAQLFHSPVPAWNPRSLVEAAIPAARSASGETKGGSLASVGRALSKTLLSGLGTRTLISGLGRLFGGGGDAPEKTPLSKFEMPAALRWEAANWREGEGPRPISGRSQDGDIRVDSPSRAASAPSITVQVQAMDSRSFLDHSDEIARAVREAMLNMHPLNDVINDL